ncbi:MAG TPA: fumarylacetoacetate hydrolase family protein [Candidatus Hydrogenedentes bacterium]|nr:fumarylacetoacetate hydrolase family protein [Candidatus Hydrogenedentota bacterium]HNT87990.1 fumarylacetoacetate hydrolase family protein [Candidatus Hydrogenedentota bacterium]
MKLAHIQLADGSTSLAVQGEEGRLFRALGDPLAGNVACTDEVLRPVRWLPPVAPRLIMCIGRNYAEHAAESGAPLPEYPVLFMKNLSAANGHEQPIRIPKVCSDEIDYEGELAVVLKHAARDVSPEAALEYVLGYMAANDVSARIWQSEKGGSQWNRGKGFDTFAPLGPVLVTADEIPDPQTLNIRTMLNGREVQHSNTRHMIFDVATLISFLSQDTTLLPGTVILTGTPEGVGWARDPKLTMHPGDTVSVEIEKIGCLSNPVVAG